MCNGSHTPEVKVDMAQDNVAGVKLPVFNKVPHLHSQSATTVAQSPSLQHQVAVQTDKGEDIATMGLAGGGAQIRRCQEQYSSLLANIIKLASLQVRTVC